nr:Tn3 family transposase [Phaeobacter italicus]
MEDTGRGLPRKDVERDGTVPLPSKGIGVAVRVSLTIDWLLDADMQRRAQIGLNKGEAHHALKSSLRIGRQGEIPGRTSEAQHYRMAELKLQAHISLLEWAHILLTGEHR